MKFTIINPTKPRKVVALKGRMGYHEDGIFIRDIYGKIMYLGPDGLESAEGAVWERIAERENITPIYEGDKLEVEF